MNDQPKRVRNFIIYWIVVGPGTAIMLHQILLQMHGWYRFSTFTVFASLLVVKLCDDLSVAMRGME